MRGMLHRCPLVWTLLLSCLISIVIVGCNDLARPPATPPGESQPQRPLQDTDIRGTWEATAGDIGISEQTNQQIYSYDWYAFMPSATGVVTVTWDNGHTCARTVGLRIGNEIHLQERDVTVEVEFHTAQQATITFWHGRFRLVKQLVKQRDDPNVPCL